MNIGVYYFTRTGNCKRIAEKIASQLKLNARAIKDDVNWNGWKAYLKFQSYAKGKKDLNLEYDGDIQTFDRLIVVCPVWGSRMPPTVKKFVEQVPTKKVDLIISSKLDKMKGIEDYHHTVHIKQSKTKEKEDKVIDDYIDYLMKNTINTYK